MRSVPILSKIFVCVYLSIQAQLNHCTCPMEERGWAQNDDGTLKDASEMEWPDSPTDEQPKLDWPEPTNPIGSSSSLPEAAAQPTLPPAENSQGLKIRLHNLAKH